MHRTHEIYYRARHRHFALRPRWPAAIVFAITLSFLFTTPGVLSFAHPLNGFLLKDIMFLGGALVTASEAFSAEYLSEAGARRIRIAA